MSVELVRSYLEECVQTYRACADTLGVAIPDLDLLALLRAARRETIPRSGELTTREGIQFGYRVHGAGYTFTALASGREIWFDVGIKGGNQCIRFTTLSVQRFVAGLGQDVTPGEIEEALQRPDALRLQVVHFTEGASDYYCYQPAGRLGA